MSLYPPPPRMPSPQLVPAALSPPVFPRRVSSRSRLHLPPHLNEPPIPPRLVGSALLEKLVHPDPATLTPKIQKQLWFDGDEFGTRRATPMQTDGLEGFPFSESSPSPPHSPSSRRFHRRTPAVAPTVRARSHSPPPPQQSSTVSIPPVPPIPSTAFDAPGTKRPILRTPPPSASRARPAQIIIPDLSSSDSTNAFAPNGLPSPALRTNRASASPRRRGPLGCKSL